MSNINVTPLVDVMLVLLIVFMITAPMLTVGVPVDLPKTNANQLNTDADQLIITMNENREIYVQDSIVESKDLIPRLKAIANVNSRTRIFVRGDKTINYGRVLEVMGRLSGAGFSKVALISEPYKN